MGFSLSVLLRDTMPDVAGVNAVRRWQRVRYLVGATSAELIESGDGNLMD
jgi:hypothetical protein